MVLLYWFFIKWTREDDRPVQISRSSSNLKMKTKNVDRYVDELRVETDGEQDPSSEARF